MPHKPKTTEQEFGIFCRRVCKRCNTDREITIKDILAGCPVVKLAAYRRLKDDHSFGYASRHLNDEIAATITTPLVMATANATRGM